MAKGKAWTDEQKDMIIQSLREYLELGFSRNKACKLIGLPPQTLSNWIKVDEALGMKVEGWENAINKLAMANIVDALNKESEMDDDARKDTTKWWLERKMKKDFSTRVENDLTTNGKELPTPILGNVPINNSTTKDSETGQED